MNVRTSIRRYTANAFSAILALLLFGCNAQPAFQHDHHPDDHSHAHANDHPHHHDAPAKPAIASVQPETCGDIKNLHRVGNLYLAGQPTPKDFALLKDLGIQTVVNFRRDTETPDFNEAALLQDLGMTYVHLPWSDAEDLTDQRLGEMRRLFREAERPMLVHCGTANRVAAGWLAYRVLDEGVNLQTALFEAKTIGLRTPAYETITLEYIASR